MSAGSSRSGGGGVGMTWRKRECEENCILILQRVRVVSRDAANAPFGLVLSIKPVVNSKDILNNSLTDFCVITFQTDAH